MMVLRHSLDKGEWVWPSLVCQLRLVTSQWRHKRFWQNSTFLQCRGCGWSPDDWWSILLVWYHSLDIDKYMWPTPDGPWRLVTSLWRHKMTELEEIYTVFSTYEDVGAPLITDEGCYWCSIIAWALSVGNRPLPLVHDGWWRHNDVTKCRIFEKIALFRRFSCCGFPLITCQGWFRCGILAGTWTAKTNPNWLVHDGWWRHSDVKKRRILPKIAVFRACQGRGWSPERWIRVLSVWYHSLDIDN